jgi:hypothetical protein
MSAESLWWMGVALGIFSLIEQVRGRSLFPEVPDYQNDAQANAWLNSTAEGRAAGLKALGRSRVALVFSFMLGFAALMLGLS